MGDTRSDQSSSTREIAAAIEAALYEKAIDLLSRREHSRAELLRKLAAKTPVTKRRRKRKMARSGNNSGDNTGNEGAGAAAIAEWESAPTREQAGKLEDTVAVRLANGYGSRDYEGRDSVTKSNDTASVAVESIDTSALIEQVLDRLEQSDYLSDERFAELFAEQRYRKGYGERDISAGLRARGIDRRLSEQSLQRLCDECDVDWYSHATEVLRGRFRGRAENEQLRPRMIRFLQQRGFSSDQVLHAVEQFIE